MRATARRVRPLRCNSSSSVALTGSTIDANHTRPPNRFRANATVAFICSRADTRLKRASRANGGSWRRVGSTKASSRAGAVKWFRKATRTAPGAGGSIVELNAGTSGSSVGASADFSSSSTRHETSSQVSPRRSASANPPSPLASRSIASSST